MKTLIAFGMCCVFMTATLIWMIRPALIVPTVPLEPRPVTVQHVERSPSVGPTEAASRAMGSPTTDPLPVAATEPLSLSTQPMTGEGVPARISGAVQSAGERRRTQEERRLAAALDAIARDGRNAVAIDDAIAAASALRHEETLADLLGRKLHLNPDDQELRFSYAGALMRLRRWVSAQSELRTVAAARPDDVRVWHNLAIAQQATGSLTEARDTWSKVIALASQDVDARARRAEILLDLGDWEGAATDLEAVVAFDPGATDAALNLALARMKLRQFDAARTVIRPLLASDALAVAARRRLEEIDSAERELRAVP